MSIEYPPGMNTAPRPPSDREIQFLRRAEAFKRAALVTIGLILLFLVVVSTVTVVLIRHQQVQNVGTLQSAKSAATNARRTAHRVLGCTTAGRPCFEAGQRQAAKEVGTVGNYAVVSAGCAVKLGPEHSADSQSEFIDRVAACTVAELTRQQHRKGHR